MSVVRFASWSLRAKLGALLVLASVLPLALVAYSDVREARAQLTETMSGVLAARSDELAERIDALNERYLRSAAKFARLPEIVAYCASLEPSAELEASTRAVLNAQPAEDANILAAAVVSPRSVATTSATVGVARRELVLRPYVQQALRGASVVSDVHVEVLNGREAPTIAYAQPVRGPTGAPSGVLVLWLKAETLWRIAKLSNALAGAGSFAVMFNEHGIRIAHTYRDNFVFRPGGPLTSAERATLLQEQRYGARTAELLADVHAFPEQFERARTKSPEPSLFLGYAPVNQQLNYGVTRRLTTRPWTLFYMIPKRTLDDQIAGMMRERVAVGLAITLAALAIGLLFARAILKPLQSLSEATERLASGELGARVSLAPRRDELGKLIERFNTMASKIESQAAALSSARDDLERRVKDRTAELIQTARLLEDEVKQRRHTELELRRSQGRFAALADAGVVGLITVNLDTGRTIDANDAALSIVGYSREEAMAPDFSWGKLTPPDWQPFDDLARLQLQAEHVVRPREKEYFHKDGHRVPVLVGAAPVRESPSEIVALVLDLSERRRAEATLTRLRETEASEARYRAAKEEAEAANRELEAFSYSVAHDLRAPLRGMNGFAHLLLSDYGDKLDADGQDWLQEIVSNAQKMGELIDALLSLARLTRSELRRQDVELSQVVHEVARELSASQPERKVDWSIAEDVRADVDPVLARAAIENLMANAWKFSGKNAGAARIEFGITDERGELTYFVRDNGAGFDAAFSKKLFAPFQRLHTQAEFPGTGVGLATVQRIVQRHGGRVWAESAVNRGATFYFTLSNRSGAS